MTELKPTAFRLTDEDLAILDEAKHASGMLSRADALRFVLRYWAKREKVDVAKLGKRKGKTNR